MSLVVCLDVPLDLFVGFCILFVPLPFPLSCNCCLPWLSSSFLTQSSLLSRLITTPCVARLGSLLRKSVVSLMCESKEYR